MIHLKVLGKDNSGNLVSSWTRKHKLVYTPNEWTVAKGAGLFTFSGKNLEDCFDQMTSYVFRSEFMPVIWMCSVRDPIKQVMLSDTSLPSSMEELKSFNYYKQKFGVVEPAQTHKRVKIYQKINLSKYGYDFINEHRGYSDNWILYSRHW